MGLLLLSPWVGIVPLPWVGIVPLPTVWNSFCFFWVWDCSSPMVWDSCSSHYLEFPLLSPWFAIPSPSIVPAVHPHPSAPPCRTNPGPKSRQGLKGRHPCVDSTPKTSGGDAVPEAEGHPRSWNFSSTTTTRHGSGSGSGSSPGSAPAPRARAGRLRGSGPASCLRCPQRPRIPRNGRQRLPCAPGALAGSRLPGYGRHQREPGRDGIPRMPG